MISRFVGFSVVLLLRFFFGLGFDIILFEFFFFDEEFFVWLKSLIDGFSFGGDKI